MTDSIRDARLQQPTAQDVNDLTDARRLAEKKLRDEDDEAVSDGGDVSPHYGGRAQPGDILGIETGGETTAIGESATDENKRRREAEKDASKLKIEPK